VEKTKVPKIIQTPTSLPNDVSVPDNLPVGNIADVPPHGHEHKPTDSNNFMNQKLKETTSSPKEKIKIIEQPQSISKNDPYREAVE